jgi:hypothetical protein
MAPSSVLMGMVDDDVMPILCTYTLKVVLKYAFASERWSLATPLNQMAIATLTKAIKSTGGFLHRSILDHQDCAHLNQGRSSLKVHRVPSRRPHERVESGNISWGLEIHHQLSVPIGMADPDKPYKSLTHI